MKEMYLIETNSLKRRGMALGKIWLGGYICKRGTARGVGAEQAKREYLDRERWRLFCCGHPQGEQGIRVILHHW